MYYWISLIFFFVSTMLSGQSLETVQKAELVYKEGNYDGAEAILVRALVKGKYKKHLGHTYFLLGKIASVRQEDFRAIGFYTLALKQGFKEELGKLYMLRAISYRFIGQRKESCNDLKEAQRLGEEQAMELIGQVCH